MVDLVQTLVATTVVEMVDKLAGKMGFQTVVMRVAQLAA
jgi:hypothetical protein